MKIFLSLFAGILAFAAVPAFATGSFATLAGNYSGVCTADIISSASGPVTIVISPPARKKWRTSIVIAGTLSPTGTAAGTGNATPMKGRVSFRKRRVVADSFLLGLGAKRAAPRITRLHGGGKTYRFTLESAEGKGRVRYVLKLRKGVLTITGVGFFRPGDSSSQPARIEISAQRS